MTSPRLLFATLLACFSLVSCKIEKVDSRNPTVSQQDAYDVSWGLPPRKSRGNPKLRYQYNARNEYSAPVSEAPAAPAPATPSYAAPSAPNPAPMSPTIPANLR